MTFKRVPSVTKSLLAKADVARNLRKTMPRGLRDGDEESLLQVLRTGMIGKIFFQSR
jgi:hypothetical protein